MALWYRGVFEIFPVPIIIFFIQTVQLIFVYFLQSERLERTTQENSVLCDVTKALEVERHRVDELQVNSNSTRPKLG